MTDYIGGIVVTIILVGTLLVGVFLGYNAGSDACINCNVGVENIAGDYFPQRHDCAVKDCVAFNEYNKQNNIEMTCVV